MSDTTTSKDIKNVDTLAETPFSQLFHEARTTSKGNPYTGVTVPIKTNDRGHVISVGDVVKTRKGEHFRESKSWNGTVSLPIKPFMETKYAGDYISEQLNQIEKKHQRPA